MSPERLTGSEDAHVVESHVELISVVLTEKANGTEVLLQLFYRTVAVIVIDVYQCAIAVERCQELLRETEGSFLLSCIIIAPEGQLNVSYVHILLSDTMGHSGPYLSLACKRTNLYL